MRRILVVLTVAALMAGMLVAGALPVYAVANDNTSCVGEAFSEAPAGSQGVLVSTTATGTEPGVLGAGLSTFAPKKEPCSVP
jgi:hypothetical protein